MTWPNGLNIVPTQKLILLSAPLASLAATFNGFYGRIRLSTPSFEDTLTQDFEQVSHIRDLNPIDPNPAVAARVVFPQSGRSRPEKRPFFFHIFPHFSKIEPPKKYLPLIGVSYIKLKLMKCPFGYKENYSILMYSYM